jgi:uncharacterized protein (TIGR02453 family)
LTKIGKSIPLVKFICMDIAALLKFLGELKKNNSKEWFDANRKTYGSLRKDWIVLVDDIIAGIAAFDPEIVTIKAKDCIFRINKDIRFSKDKSPYKTNFGASINIGGKKEFLGGYYFHLAPDEIFIAGGTYMPSAPVLAAIRQEIDYNLKEFKMLVEDKKIVKRFGNLDGEKLSRPPKGYDADNPALDYLKLKSLVLVQHLKPEELKPNSILKTILPSFELMKPFNDFLRRTQ